MPDKRISELTTEAPAVTDVIAYADLSAGVTKKTTFATPTAAKTATFTATSAEYILLCNAENVSLVINLPTAVAIKGKIFIIKKVDASNNSVTIDGNEAETIDGGLTAIITTQFESLTIVSDNANWNII